MMLVSGIWVLALWLAQGPADIFQQAPPDVDGALRDRVTKFYQAHVEGKFRQADQYVAEDSKDYFFEARKPRYKQFEFSRVTYSDNFTRAKVTVISETEILIPIGGMKVPAKIPITSTWKLEKGLWYWYHPPEPQTVVTPFGVMKPGPEPKGGAVLGEEGLPKGPLPKGQELAAVAQMIKVDKEAVQLAADSPGSVEVTFTNGMRGSVLLRVDGPQVDGLEVKLDHQQVNASETARITISYRPPAKGPKSPTVIRLHVDPLNDVIPIRVTFN